MSSSQRRCCGGSHSQSECTTNEKSKRKMSRKREGNKLENDNSLALDLSKVENNNMLPQPKKSPRLNRTSERIPAVSTFRQKSTKIPNSGQIPKSTKLRHVMDNSLRKKTVARPHSSVAKVSNLTKDRSGWMRPGTAPLIKVTEPLPSTPLIEVTEPLPPTTLIEVTAPLPPTTPLIEVTAPFTAWSETELLEAIEKTSLLEDEDSQSVITDTSLLPCSTLNDDSEDDEQHKLKDPIQKLMEIPPDDGEYDTDLDEEFPAGQQKEYDSTGRTIYLEQCQAEGVDPISFVLRNFHQPKLQLCHRYMSARDIKPLAQALGSNSCIEDLDLNDNHLTDEGALAIAVMMRNNNYIHKLDLSDNVIGRKGAAAMSFMLESNYTLKKLCLSGNHLTDIDASILSNGLRTNGTLTELDLSYNEFGETGGVSLGLALAANDGLVYLDLRWNSLRGKGAVAIANALKVNTSLEVLDLSKNAVGLPGCIAFMRSLKVNHGLRILNLSHNHVNPQATQKLALGLKKNIRLEVLMLNSNPIGDEGIVALLKALVVNTSLKLLNLMDSIIAVSVINEFINKNQTQVIDKFYAVDEERTGFILATQFVTTLLEAGCDVRKSDLKKVLTILHLEDSHKISYRHILNGCSALCQDTRIGNTT
ncbi:uncharacterized protein [Antedon mediterranea]|uniref:uncharacterized protein isoform X2 n=1 Tax=Antedon mediterranea TaxID=105859 RepID=UPI003AF43E0C